MRVLHIGLFFLVACTSRNQAEPNALQAATDSVVAQFGDTPLVAVGEHHRSRQVHTFLLALLANEAFPDHVDDIVVEFGSAYYQPIVDRYVGGADVPREELQEVWRGTGQWLAWDSPLYEQLLSAVRARNASLPRDKQLRVLLGDPPIHWPFVRSADDYRAFAERDAHYAGVVEREVLAKGRRALLVMGAGHFQKRGPLDSAWAAGRPGVGELLTRKHPGAFFVVWTLPATPGLAEQLGFDSTAAFRRVRGSRFDQESFARLVPPRIRVRRIVGADTQWVPLVDAPWPPISEVVDALLFLGTDTTTVDPDPAIYRDPAYQAELRRRAVILSAFYGFDFLPQLEALLEQRPSR